jgi:hypothetical protein
VVNDIRFADDQGMKETTEHRLQLILDRLNESAKKFDMKINVKKSKEDNKEWWGNEHKMIDRQKAEHVNKLTILERGL